MSSESPPKRVLKIRMKAMFSYDKPCEYFKPNTAGTGQIVSRVPIEVVRDRKWPVVATVDVIIILYQLVTHNQTLNAG
jgi:hypothetical protein